MSRTYLFFKVEVEHDPSEPPDKIANEISQRVNKMYGVRNVELSHSSATEE